MLNILVTSSGLFTSSSSSEENVRLDFMFCLYDLKCPNLLNGTFITSCTSARIHNMLQVLSKTSDGLKLSLIATTGQGAEILFQ